MEDRMVFNGTRTWAAILAVAAMLVFAMFASAPAFGQATAINDEDNVIIEDSFNTICPQVVTAAGEQNNYSDANAAATGESEAAAAIAQEFGITVEQVNQCLSGAGDGDDSASERQYEDANGDEVIKNTVPNKKLPDTGGMPLSGILIFGVLLTGAGAAILRGRG